MSHRFIEVTKVGLFCDAVNHATEKRKDGEVKVIQVTARIQPFDAKLATAIDQQLRQALFRLNTADAHPHIRRIDFALGVFDVERQQLQVFASPDTVKASIAFDQVKIASCYARVQKDVNGYALILKLVWGPVGAKELEFVEAWRNSQRFVTFEAAEPSELFDGDGADDDDDEAEEAQGALPVHQFDTDESGRPLEAGAAEGSEPVRQRLQSHAGGRKKANKRTTH